MRGETFELVNSQFSSACPTSHKVALGLFSCPPSSSLVIEQVVKTIPRANKYFLFDLNRLVAGIKIWQLQLITHTLYLYRLLGLKNSGHSMLATWILDRCGLTEESAPVCIPPRKENQVEHPP